MKKIINSIKYVSYIFLITMITTLVLNVSNISLVRGETVTQSAFAQIAASNYTEQFGIQTEACSEGGQDVGFTDNNDYTVYDNVDFGNGVSLFNARVASGNNGGTIEMRIDSLDGSIIGNCSVPGTNGWQSWITVSTPITIPISGVHNLYLKYIGNTGNGNLFNISWFKFNSKSAFSQIAASSYDNQYGIQPEACSEGDQDIGFIDNGDYTVYNNVDFEDGASSFDARVASNTNGGNIEIRLDNINSTPIGICSVPGTGNWQSWTTVSTSVSPIKGIHNIYLKYTGGAGNLFNVSWFKFNNTTPTNPSKTGDVVGHLFAGYQGWFNAYGDGSPNNSWVHWTDNNNSPTPNSNIKFDLYPDTREYSQLYQTSLGNLGNGESSKLFSSYNESTIDTHFKWMKDYNIDGAALQRFGASADQVLNPWEKNRDSVAVKVKNAAENYDRKFYIMYDITGMDSSSWVDYIKYDFTNNVIDKMNLISSSAYAKQDGKPVICIWGIGFNDRPGDKDQCLDIINWFKDQGYYIIGGVPTYWRTGINDSRPDFLDVYNKFDMLSPWLVGRFGMDSVDDFKRNVWTQDYAYCQQNNIDYQPVIWPGFSWANMTKQNTQNQIPRLHGDFMWKQAYDFKSLGISTGYVAMFDEYDEGTAIAKAAENKSMIPNNQYFLTLNADGVECSSDFYLRLAGDINRLFKGEISLTENHPTSHK
ncbi:carbohydrate-binding protein [uncultured Clostridium sp.]|uniref:carbohydrate-binding protein n=1 Tax=uncultured Clostridium sp. TaxID=59620 RepID=UPI0028EA7CBC|nr:carbohydrate-binding protein [uncultured Clostridium sp.]